MGRVLVLFYLPPTACGYSITRGQEVFFIRALATVDRAYLPLVLNNLPVLSSSVPNSQSTKQLPVASRSLTDGLGWLSISRRPKLRLLTQPDKINQQQCLEKAEIQQKHR